MCVCVLQPPCTLGVCRTRRRRWSVAPITCARSSVLRRAAAGNQARTPAPPGVMRLPVSTPSSHKPPRLILGHNCPHAPLRAIFSHIVLKTATHLDRLLLAARRFSLQIHPQSPQAFVDMSNRFYGHHDFEHSGQDLRGPCDNMRMHSTLAIPLR